MSSRIDPNDDRLKHTFFQEWMKLKTKHVYDRINHMKPDWDPMVRRDDRLPVKDMIVDVRSHDFEKAVPILTNTIYGHRHKSFYDFVSDSPANRSEYAYQRSFIRRDKICGLPPLVGSMEHPHIPRYDHSM